MNLFELSLLDKIQEIFGCRFLDGLMPYITSLGEYGIVSILLALVLILNKKTRKTGIQLALSLILGLIVLNGLLKNIIVRPRPYKLNPDFPLLVKYLNDSSFPSGHAACCFETATVIFLKNKKFGILAFLLALLVSFSRLYLYVHYPSDVLAGALIGTLIGIFSVFAINKFFEKENLKHR